MRNSRKVIAQALLNQLQSGITTAGVTINLASRIGRMETNLNQGDLPALLLYHPSEQGKQENMGMSSWRMHFVAWLVTRIDPSPNAPSPPDDQICDLMDAIDDAMDPIKSGDLSGRITLGGLVTNAWIDGQLDIDGGIIDQPVVIQIPLTVLDGM